MIKQIKSLIYLGYYFVLHWPRRIRAIYKGESGERLFLEYYRPDGISLMTPAERKAFPDLQNCIGCGLCAAHSDFLAKLKSKAGLTPGLIGVALSRSGPDMWTCTELVSEYSDIGEIDEICPQGVQLNALLGYIRDRVQRLER